MTTVPVDSRGRKGTQAAIVDVGATAAGMTRRGSLATRIQEEIEPFQGFFFAAHDAVELRIAHLFQEPGEVGAGAQAVTHEVVARDERRGVDRAGGLIAEIGFAIIDMAGVARIRQGVGAVQGEQFVDPRPGQEAFQLGVAQGRRPDPGRDANRPAR